MKNVYLYNPVGFIEKNYHNYNEICKRTGVSTCKKTREHCGKVYFKKKKNGGISHSEDFGQQKHGALIDDSLYRTSTLSVAAYHSKGPIEYVTPPQLHKTVRL